MTLPKELESLRSDIRSAANYLDTYERAVILNQFTGDSTTRQQENAWAKVEQRLQKVTERIGMHPREKRQLIDLVNAQRTELARRQHTINTLLQTQGLLPEATQHYLPPEDPTTPL